MNFHNYLFKPKNGNSDDDVGMRSGRSSNSSEIAECSMANEVHSEEDKEHGN